MRDQFSTGKPGDQLSAEQLNRIGRVISQAPFGVPGSFSHGIQNAAFRSNAPPGGWVQELLEVTDISLQADGLYKGQIVGYAKTPDKWLAAGTVYVIDASGFESTAGGEFAVKLGQELRYMCYWDSQRGAFVPICCPTSSLFECLIFVDSFNFPIDAGTTFYDDIDQPGTDDWIVLAEDWELRRNAPPQLVDPTNSTLGYHGAARALIPEDPDNPGQIISSQAHPFAIVKQRHPQGIADGVASASITLRRVGDKGTVVVGYQGPPELELEDVDYYFGEVEAGDADDPARFPGMLRLYHFRDTPPVGEVQLELLAETEVVTLEMTVNNVTQRGTKSVHLDVCVFDGKITASLNKTLSVDPGDEVDAGSGRPGTALVSITVEANPIGDRVGIRVSNMKRDDFDDSREFPIEFNEFLWFHHRDEPVDPNKTCEFCLQDCGTCEIDETPPMYMAEFNGVGNNDTTLQCVKCPVFNDTVFLMPLVGTNVTQAGQIIPGDTRFTCNNCCHYRVGAACAEFDPDFTASPLCGLEFWLFGLNEELNGTFRVMAENFKGECWVVAEGIVSSPSGRDGVPVLPDVDNCKTGVFDIQLINQFQTQSGGEARACDWDFATVKLTPVFPDE